MSAISKNFRKIRNFVTYSCGCRAGLIDLYDLIWGGSLRWSKERNCLHIVSGGSGT